MRRKKLQWKKFEEQSERDWILHVLDQEGSVLSKNEFCRLVDRDPKLEPWKHQLKDGIINLNYLKICESNQVYHDTMIYLINMKAVHLVITDLTTGNEGLILVIQEEANWLVLGLWNYAIPPDMNYAIRSETFVMIINNFRYCYTHPYLFDFGTPELRQLANASCVFHELLNEEKVLQEA